LPGPRHDNAGLLCTRAGLPQGLQVGLHLVSDRRGSAATKALLRSANAATGLPDFLPRLNRPTANRRRRWFFLDSGPR
jgi:hypothetical protein